MLAILAPGQGAQTPGFLAPWLELSAFAAQIATAGAAADLDLVRLGTEADAETIKDTAIAQPLLVAAGLATLAVLSDGGVTADLYAGHSVGEITAAAAAGVLDDKAAMGLVATRGRAMAAASAVVPTGMTAVIGGDRTEVLLALAFCGLTPANDNGPGQMVAAGTLAQLGELASAPPAKARLIPLSVAGAFHTHHMAPAQGDLAALAATLVPVDPAVRLLSNADGAVLTDGQQVLSRLVSQVANPVRWDLCMDAMRTLGVTGIIELLPGGTLVGLAKRGLRGVASIAVKTPDDLDAARALMAEHKAAT